MRTGVLVVLLMGQHHRPQPATRRVGVVVAVDGRNIISGKQSWLRNDERMYILEPYGVGEFKGWRTSLDSINRRYFLAGFASGIAIWVR